MQRLYGIGELEWNWRRLSGFQRGLEDQTIEGGVAMEQQKLELAKEIARKIFDRQSLTEEEASALTDEDVVWAVYAYLYDMITQSLV